MISSSGHQVLQVRQRHSRKLFYRVLSMLIDTWMTAPRERAQMALVILSRMAAFQRSVDQASVQVGVKEQPSWLMVFRKRE
jgi:hypothetical protein